ncbi:hypothetical protein ScalyP_jg12170 [Parmales sp. scaly parma]|nr:hypothetical protein ScalyP_jg12170 [Parmales sp. scaly parma]
MSKINTTENDHHQTIHAEVDEQMPWFPAKTFKNEAGVFFKRNTSERIWLVFEDPSTSRMGKWMSIIMMLLIVISCVGFILASVPSYCEVVETGATAECSTAEEWARYDATQCGADSDSSCDCTVPIFEPTPIPIFDTIEAVCIYLFTADYVIRMATVGNVDPGLWNGKTEWTGGVKRTWKYSIGALNMVDIVAIIPFWIEVILQQGSPLGFVRVLRLARVFRIFKLGKYNEGMSLFARTLHASIPALSLLCFFVMIGVVLFGSIIFFIEGGTFRQSDLCPDGFYWVMVTMTTVGYGDQFPQTPLGKFFTIICMLCGILTLALPITVLGSNFANEYDAMHGKSDEEAQEEKKFWEHFASMVADNMIGDSEKKLSVNASVSRARLRTLLLSHAQGPATMAQGFHHVPNLSGKGAESEGGSGSGSGSPSTVPVTPSVSGQKGHQPVNNDGVVTQLQMMMEQMATTIEGLKMVNRNNYSSNSGEMEVEEINSRNSSPANVQPMPRRGASGSINIFTAEQDKLVKQKGKVKEKLSGVGVMPTFDIYKSVCVQQQQHVDDNDNNNTKITIENLDKEEEFKHRHPQGHTLNLQSTFKKTGSSKLARDRLQKMGKSFKWGHSMMKTAKTYKGLGETSKRVEVEVLTASGFHQVDQVAFTVVMGPKQHETESLGLEEGGVVAHNSVMTYDIPLSTHSGTMLVSNVEIIAHCGEEVLGSVVVGLKEGVNGQVVEYRLNNSNNLYLKIRNGNGSGNENKNRNKRSNFAGSGRVGLRMSFVEDKSGDKAEHKFGTSFGKFLVSGKKIGAGGERIMGEEGFRPIPVYPKMAKESRMWRDSGGGGGVGGGVKYNMSESASVKRRSELNEFMHNTKTQ